jgi:hypothetical protein
MNERKTVDDSYIFPRYFLFIDQIVCFHFSLVPEKNQHVLH